MSPKIGVVVFGASGKKGWEYTQIMASMGDVFFVAFVVNNNIRPELEALSKHLNVPILKYQSEEYNRFFKTHSFQTALVATPHHVNCEITEMLLKRKVFVIQEKPLALKASIAMEFQKTIQEQEGFPIFTTVQRGTMPIFDFARKKLSEMGSIKSAEYVFDRKVRSPISGWRADRESGGCGIIQDAGYHPIHLIHEFFGTPIYSEAEIAFESLKTEEKKLESFAAIKFSYPHFNVMIRLNAHGTRKEDTFTIRTEKGSLKVLPFEGRIEIYDCNEFLVEKIEFPYKKETMNADMLGFALKSMTAEHKQELERRFLLHVETTKTIDNIYKNCTRARRQYVYTD